MTKCGLSVVIPAYNEEGNIGDFVLELRNFLQTIDMFSEIIVVDDGSFDLTATTVKSLVPQVSSLRLFSHGRNLGLGAALKTGFENAAYDSIFWLPGDGQLPVSEIRKFLDVFSGCDMVVSLYEKRGDGCIRNFVSSTWRFLLKILVGYDVRIQGNYLFRKELLNGITLFSNTGLMNLEFPNKVKNAGHKIKTVVMKCEARRSGRSKVFNLRTILKTFKEMLDLRNKK